MDIGARQGRQEQHIGDRRELRGGVDERVGGLRDRATPDHDDDRTVAAGETPGDVVD